MKILLVHGYEVLPSVDGVKLSDLAIGINERVLAIQQEYDKILLLGGWHMKVGARPTIGEMMFRWLKDRSADADKLFTQYHLGMATRMPARNSMEEVEVGIEMLQRLPPGVHDVHFIAQWFHVLIDWFYYDKRGVTAIPIPVFTATTSERIIGNAKAFVTAIADPMGRSQGVLDYLQSRTLGGPPDYVNPIRQ